MHASLITPEMTVREVAAAYPATLRILEALGIDFCCGGKLSLAEAAAEKTLPVATVIAVLEASIIQATGQQAAADDWQDAPLDTLIAHIVETHHNYLHNEMPRIERLLALVARVHGPQHSDVLVPLVDIYAALQQELTQHLEKEETVIFPAIRRLLAGERTADVLLALDELEAEHEHAGDALAAMHRVTHEFALPDDACNSFRGLYAGLQGMEKDIHQHIHLENNILFPRVKKLAA